MHDLQVFWIEAKDQNARPGERGTRQQSCHKLNAIEKDDLFTP